MPDAVQHPERPARTQLGATGWAWLDDEVEPPARPSAPDVIAYDEELPLPGYGDARPARGAER